MKGGRALLPYIVALYARSLEGSDYDPHLGMVRVVYDVQEHPPFADYVSGVLWEAERVDGNIGRLPNYPDELRKLKKRFSPRALKGLDTASAGSLRDQIALRDQMAGAALSRFLPARRSSGEGCES